ncbi:MAG: DUF2007 domain-containing protein [Anaerolineales bacterium]|nr:DUF2007 domain-containing protein [Anaerolineales bacterium]
MDERYRWQSQEASRVANQPPILERLARKLNEFVTQQAKTGGSGNHMHSNEWKVVVKLYGMLEAQALIGRLQAEGIPAQAWQEGAGKALGLTVGYLGEVRVVVPSNFYEEAKAIAAIDFSEDEELDDDEWADADDDEIEDPD